MNRINFIIGATIGIMTLLLVLNIPHPVKASTCTTSASAGGVRQAGTLAAIPAQRQQTADQGCSAASLAVGGQGGGTVRKVCGAGSCSVSNHDLTANQLQAQTLASPVAAPAAPVTAKAR